MSAPARVVGIVTCVDRASRGRALFREDVCETQDRLRDALACDGLRSVVGAAALHPAERLADDDASLRLASHALVERRADVLLAVVAEPLDDPLLLPYLVAYLGRRLTRPLPCAVASLVVPSAVSADATRRAADAAARKIRDLFGPEAAPRTDALALDLDDAADLAARRRELKALGDASAAIPREARYANDFRKFVHVVRTNEPSTHPDVVAAERLLVAHGLRVVVCPVGPGESPTPPTDFDALLADRRARREAARSPKDRWWDDPARDDD